MLNNATCFGPIRQTSGITANDLETIDFGLLLNRGYLRPEDGHVGGNIWVCLVPRLYYLVLRLF